jgi:hypothetical protein
MAEDPAEADESALPEATDESRAGPDDEPETVAAGGRKAGIGLVGNSEGLLSRPLSDSFADVDVVIFEITTLGGRVVVGSDFA